MNLLNGRMIDTNVASELIRQVPEPRVKAWIQVQPKKELYVSVIVLGELQKGFERLPYEKRRHSLESWHSQDFVPGFQDRVLPVTREIAELWGILDERCRQRGLSLPSPDGLIAATALVHDLIVVTRNVKHFTHTGVRILNPWES